MANFLHEITNKREEHIRMNTMINNLDIWANEEVMEPAPPWPLTLQQDTSWDIGQGPF